ncbi:hypothetical protein HAX54_034144, partial [Datura stramonium]|nr:hypothetical protein [Datura stramonium]
MDAPSNLKEGQSTTRPPRFNDNLKNYELKKNQDNYELKKQQDHERRDPKRKKIIVLKASKSYSSEEESDMEYLSRRFQMLVRKNDKFPKKGNTSTYSKGNDCCHKCGKSGHSPKSVLFTSKSIIITTLRGHPRGT